MVEIGRIFWKKVTTADDLIIGEAESAELDTVTWQVTSFYVSLNDEASTKLGFDRPYFGKIFICLPVSTVKKKIWNAFTGGKSTAAEQRKSGADPTVCSIFQYYFFLFEEDDKKLNEKSRRCQAGEMLCGECKADIAARLNGFLDVHQRRREKAKDVIDQYHIKR